MDKAWLEQKTKECESVRPEIEKILRNKLHLDDKEYINAIWQSELLK